MALALVAAAAGDGQLSDDERRWILGYFAAKGYPDDGYRDGERAAVRKAASLLGIDGQTAALEQLVADEHALRLRRIKALMPEGHPNLHARYQP